jgi:hypothetical protein
MAGYGIFMTVGLEPLGIVWWLSSGNGREETMNTLEVLTLVLVIFAALSYIDNHRH